MKIEAKDKIVAVKSYARSNPLPLDSTSLYDSLEAATLYASQANAYAGQTISVLVDGVYKIFTLQPASGGGLRLAEVGGSSGPSADLEWGSIGQ